MKKKQRLICGLLAGCLTLSAFSAVPSAVNAATTIVLSPDDTYIINNGVFEGWGTSLCWWANRLGYSDTLAQKAADTFYGDDGLRLNIARFNIGGGDNPSHHHITRTDSNMPGYTVYQNNKATYDWNADWNQRNVLQRCVKAAGDEAIVEMFSNSPPYYMCQSGCSTGNYDPGKNNLRDDSYTAFAEYLAEVCKHYETDWGIKVQSVEPLNEPYTNFWGANSKKQEGCHFDLGDSESKIIVELQKSMQARGMNDVILCGTDETSIDTQIDAYNKLSGAAKNAISRIDTHTYAGSKRSQLKDTAYATGKNLWMSEVDGNGTAGTNAGAMSGGLWLAGRITADCNQLNSSAWILWQVIDSHISSVGYNGNTDSGLPNINGGFWGVACADHDKNEIILSKKYYCFGQYTRYIRPGMIMLNSSGNTMAAYDKEKEQLVIVAYNTAGNASDMSYDLSAFGEVGGTAQCIRTSATENWADAGAARLTGDQLNVSLPANSVSTYIIDGVKGSTARANRIEIISTSGTNSWNNTASTSFEKVFDGSTGTYFDGVGGGWVQADLGDIYDISSIGFCPRKNYEYRCADGMFMVSDDGVNWKTVYTIPNQPGFGMHYVKPQIAATGRYIRYAVPEGAPKNTYNKDNVYCCNIAEIEVYGELNPAAALNRIDISTSAVTSTDAWQQTANDGTKAFDGDTATFFDGVGNGWVQADLGGLYDIQAIGYCPRNTKEYRCTDGMFQVSKDGTNWTTIHTVRGVPSFGMHYIQNFEGDATARYIRYAVPEGAPQNSYNPDNVYCCNIAEIEVYGDPAGSLSGDVNADGQVNISDAVMLCKYLIGAGDITDWLAGDINSDKKLNAIDLTMLKRILLK
ncbi:MAG: discoidin domain-containing protein [Oscillospiraceae bacterium]|nr:discoidin domain-containing protein [Oscillospiraceae bacterium]